MRWPGLGHKSFLAPEVIQSSAMDCGPAALKCLLEGFGIPVSYGRLREACQTDVDGTSIDTLEEIAVLLGLDAEQVVIPPDHLLLAESSALPALLVVRLPQGATHFVIVWRTFGRWVQVMDPGVGRRWMSVEQLLSEVYRHKMVVPADAWYAWAKSEEFTRPLAQRLRQVGIAPDQLIAQMVTHQYWRPLASLDASTRLVNSLVRSGAVHRGSEARKTLDALLERQLSGDADHLIADHFWSVLPAQPNEDEPQVTLKGIVLVRVLGRKSQTQTTGQLNQSEDSDNSDSSTPDSVAQRSDDANAQESEALLEIPPELTAALAEPKSRPSLEFLKLVGRGEVLSLGLCFVGLMIASSCLVVEAVLLRGLLDITYDLRLIEQRIGAMVYLLVFAVALMMVEWGVAGSLLRLARVGELRLRMKFLEKIPKLNDRYFQSRPKSDMAERSHATHQIRHVPWLVGQLLRSVLTLIATAAAISWLDPPSTLLAGCAAVIAIIIPLLFRSRLQERDLRVRTHTGALTRFYLDSLLGLVAIKAHNAQRSIRREHEGLLVEWARAGYARVSTMIKLESCQSISGYFLAGTILILHTQRISDPATALLLAYWALQLPALGDEVALLVSQYPLYRNLNLRLMEPLGANEGDQPTGSKAVVNDDQQIRGTGVDIRARSLNVRAAGHSILEDVSVHIKPGTHVAIVGTSGAGKSTFVGVLMGWHRVAQRQILVDNQPLTQSGLNVLREQTAWVDPEVKLWNRPLLSNVLYGNKSSDNDRLSEVIIESGLDEILSRLDDGLQTHLGGEGGLLSGAETQLVRYARALMNREARLTILDEPFRGLPRLTRIRLLAHARSWWNQSTLLCITHDMSETLLFDQVMVIQNGRLVEVGAPTDLARDPSSQLSMLLASEVAVDEAVWSAHAWRRLTIESGELIDQGDG